MFTDDAYEDYLKLDESVKERIVKKIEEMKTREGYRKLRGLPYFVAEAGQYRICFIQENNERTIVFVGDHKQYERFYTDAF